MKRMKRYAVNITMQPVGLAATVGVLLKAYVDVAGRVLTDVVCTNVIELEYAIEKIAQSLERHLTFTELYISTTYHGEIVVSYSKNKTNLCWKEYWHDKLSLKSRFTGPAYIEREGYIIRHDAWYLRGNHCLPLSRLLLAGTNERDCLEFIRQYKLVDQDGYGSYASPYFVIQTFVKAGLFNISNEFLENLLLMTS